MMHFVMEHPWVSLGIAFLILLFFLNPLYQGRIRRNTLKRDMEERDAIQKEIDAKNKAARNR